MNKAQAVEMRHTSLNLYEEGRPDLSSSLATLSQSLRIFPKAEPLDTTFTVFVPDILSNVWVRVSPQDLANYSFLVNQLANVVKSVIYSETGLLNIDIPACLAIAWHKPGSEGGKIYSRGIVSSFKF